MQSQKHFPRFVIRLLLAATLLAALFAVNSGPALASSGQGTSGAVYTLSNEAGGNSVLEFRRAANGTLSFANSYDTGGLGNGAGLGSQGSLVISRDGQFLFAVNAGSSSISSYRIDRKGRLHLLESIAGETGSSPVDMALSGNSQYLYALASGTDKISAFKVGPNGSLVNIDLAEGLPASSVGLAAR